MTRKKLLTTTMNKWIFKGFALAACGLSATAAFGQKGKVHSAQVEISRGDAESVLEAKGYIDDATAHETTAGWSFTWLTRAMVYSRIVEHKNNPLVSGISKGAGYVSAYSMVRFWNSSEIKKADIETATMESRNSFGVAFNEAEEVIGEKLYDSGVHYYQLMLFLHGKMDTADANALERQGISKKYLVERMATVASRSNDPAVKIEALNQLVDRGSTSPVVYEALSRAYLEKGDTAMAEQVVRKGLKAAPGDNAMFQLLINHYVGIGRVDLLFEDVNKQIEQNPTSRLYYTRGYLNESRSDYDKAVADYRKAVELDEFNYDANYNLGVALLKFESKKLYDKKMGASGTAKAEIDKQLKELFREAKKYLELASENKDYTVDDQINIYKALKTAALELGDSEGAAMHEEKIKALESVK
jgi:tetratricopeptide (TPR) repeat protein